jgi:hypothetical protein
MARSFSVWLMLMPIQGAVWCRVTVLQPLCNAHRFASEGGNHIAQRRQGLVDGLRLLQLLPCTAALLHPAATPQGLNFC